MLLIAVSKAYRKSVRKVRKQGKKLKKLERVILQLQNDEKLTPELKDHPLRHNWNGYRECHIEPDWLLIYRIDGNTLYLVKTGSHAELLEK